MARRLPGVCEGAAHGFQIGLPYSRFSMSSIDFSRGDPADALSAENMSLPDRIFRLCDQGVLPPQFRVGDVRRVLGDKYAETYIRRALGLYSEKPGNYTHRWNKPQFRKIKHGVYELVR